MQRDVLLLTEMIDAAEQAQALADGVTADDLAADRQRRDARSDSQHEDVLVSTAGISSAVPNTCRVPP